MSTQQNTQKQLEDEEKKKQASPGQAQPVQSSLPPIPAMQPAQPTQAVQPVQQQKPKLAAGYEQRAAAVSDPRFAQALTQKFQQDLAAQQAQLAQQQQQFQQQMQAAGGAYAGGLAGAQSRINELVGKVTSGTASESDIAEYEKLQTLQFQGPQGLQGSANAAALAQMAGSPALLAQQYAQLAPGAVSGQQIAQSLSGLGGGALADIKASAAGLQQQQLTAEQAAKQQSELASRETEAIKEQAKGRIKAESEKYLSGLRGEGEADVLAKKSALDRIKEGLFISGSLSSKDLQTLGISPTTMAQIQGLDVSQVEGLKKPVRSVADLKEVVEDLENREAANETLTPEQERVKDLYSTIEGLTQDAIISGKYAFAKKKDLAKIQALERLTGAASKTRAGELGVGREGGKISAAKIAALKGDISPFGEKYEGQEEAEAAQESKSARLTGDRWYKGGMQKAVQDVRGNLFNDEHLSSVVDVAKKLSKTVTGDSDLAKWLRSNIENLESFSNAAFEPTGYDEYGRTTPVNADTIRTNKDKTRDLADNFIRKLRSYTNWLTETEAEQSDILKERSGVTRSLTIK